MNLRALLPITAAAAAAAGCHFFVGGAAVAQEAASGIRRARDAEAKEYALGAYHDAETALREGERLLDEGKEEEANRLFEEARIRAADALALSEEKAAIAADCKGALARIDAAKARATAEDAEAYAPSLAASAANWERVGREACEAGEGKKSATHLWEALDRWTQVGDAVQGAKRFPDLAPGEVYWSENFQKCEMEPGKIPLYWKVLLVPSSPLPTNYSLERDGENCALRASASVGSLAVHRFANVDALEYPILQWRWLVWNTLPGADLGSLLANDAPARILVQFGVAEDASLRSKSRLRAGEDTAIFPAGKGLVYVWAGREPRGAVVDWPAAPESAKQIVVESGNLHLGRWRTERVNLAVDYARVFGGPVPPVAYVAILTDSDQTFGNAVALYDDLAFMKK